MLNELRTGLISAADGTVNPQRADRTGAGVVTSAHGAYYEAASRGTVFMVASQAGVTSQAGLSGTTPVLTLYNPKGSGVNASIIYAGAVFTVAFGTAGAIWAAVNTDLGAADVTGTRTTAHRCGLAGNNREPRVQAFTAATLPAAPVGVALLGVGLTGAITLDSQLPGVGREFGGALIIAPGGALSIQTGVASGASGMFCEYIWEEIDIA